MGEMVIIASGSLNRSEEPPQVLRKERRLLHCREMTAMRCLIPKA